MVLSLLGLFQEVLSAREAERSNIVDNMVRRAFEYLVAVLVVAFRDLQ